MIRFLFTKTPLFFFTQSLWRDEAFSYFLAKKNFSSIILLTAKDFNPPFYYLLLHFWIRVFGKSEISLRSLSLLFYGGCIYLTYLFISKILRIKPKKAFIYLLLIITNPALLYYAFEARMYIALTFFTLLSIYGFIKKKDKLYLISTILGLYTHYFMGLVVLTQIVYLLTMRKRKNRKHKPLKEKNPGVAFRQMAISLASFLPWMFLLLRTNNLLSKPFWIEKMTFFSVLSFPAVVYTGYEQGWGLMLKHPGLISLIILLMIGLAVVKTKGKKTITPLIHLLILWFFVPNITVIIFSLFKPIFLSRYLIFTIPSLIFVIIILLETLSPKQRAVLFILILWFNLNYNSIQVKKRKKANIARVIHEIKALAKPNDLVYVTDPLNFYPAGYYFGIEKVFIYGKTYEQLPQYIGKILIPKQKLKKLLPKYPKKAFILKDDLSYEIQALY